MSGAEREPAAINSGWLPVGHDRQWGDTPVQSQSERDSVFQREAVAGNRPLAKLGKAVNIADASNQRKAKSETASAVAVAFREDTKPFDKADSVFHKDTLL